MTFNRNLPSRSNKDYSIVGMDEQLPLKKLKSRHDVNNSASLPPMILRVSEDEDFETALDLLRITPDNCTATLDNTPDVDIDPVPANAENNQLMAIQAILSLPSSQLRETITS